MKFLRIILVLAILGGIAYWKRAELSGWKAAALKLLPGQHAEDAGPNVFALKAPPHVLDTVRADLSAAKVGNRMLVYHFSLANCGPCERLEREVLSAAPWKDFAREKLKVVDFFFPNQFTAEDKQIVQNSELMQALCDANGVKGGFPILAAVGADGSILGLRLGYQGGGASEHIAWLEKLREQDAKRPASALVKAPETNSVALTNASLPVTNAPPPPAPVAVVTNPAPAVPAKPGPETFLKLKGILGGAKPLAMLQVETKAYMISVGQELTLDTPAGKLALKCESISTNSVVLLTGEARARTELQIPGVIQSK